MNKVYKTLVLISQLGISMIVPILLCTILGVYLAEQFSMHITIPLIVAGVLAGIRNVYALVKQAYTNIKAEEDEES